MKPQGYSLCTGCFFIAQQIESAIKSGFFFHFRNLFRTSSQIDVRSENWWVTSHSLIAGAGELFIFGAINSQFRGVSTQVSTLFQQMVYFWHCFGCRKQLERVTVWSNCDKNSFLVNIVVFDATYRKIICLNCWFWPISRVFAIVTFF